MANLCLAEHARLKDYVSSMDGQLDAQIQEGGMIFFFFGPLSEPMETNMEQDRILAKASDSWFRLRERYSHQVISLCWTRLR